MGLTLGLITLTEVTENQGRTDTANLYKVETQSAAAEPRGGALQAGPPVASAMTRLRTHS